MDIEEKKGQKMQPESASSFQTLHFLITKECYRTVTRASSSTNRRLLATGYFKTTAYQAAIIVSELATNIHHYAGEGFIFLKYNSDRIHIIALDRGPGIEDLKPVSRDHFSTTPGNLGIGLSSIKRLSCHYHFRSKKDVGTLIKSLNFPNRRINYHETQFSCEKRARVHSLASENTEGWWANWNKIRRSLYDAR